MNKTQLINEISERTSLNKSESLRALNSLMDIINCQLASENEVYIKDLGRFYTKVRKERTGRNLKTGSEIIIPQQLVPAFKPSLVLKQIINK
ncbi:MAG: HU family DNA-binding protein [Burkholderiales bacterium]|nr:HU family DNA-binding protein [Burkholderiales bacterium]